MDVVDGVLSGNNYAKIVRDCWHDLAVHYPRIRLDEFVIMPNHVHGIINIRDSVVVGAGSSRPFSGSPRPIYDGRDDRAPTMTGPDDRDTHGRDDRPLRRRDRMTAIHTGAMTGPYDDGTG